MHERLNKVSKFIYRTNMGKRMSFIRGAEYEHKKLMQKACEWLEKNMNSFVYEGEVNGIKITCLHTNFLDEFKKAMDNEEE